MVDDTLEISQDFMIQNSLGLHARAAAAFVKIANRFQSDITVVKDDSQVNGKSIMGVLMLAASKGAKVSITVKGDDAKEAMKALGRLIDEKFGED